MIGADRDDLVHLRPLGEDDLGFLMKAEATANALGLVGHWPEDTHRSCLGDRNMAYWMLEVEPNARPAGFAILRGPLDVNGSRELKRIVVSEPDRGIGRRGLRAIQRLAFDDLGAHRLWLDVFEHNTRARHVYASEGFVEEGTLRECVKRIDGYASLVVMSMLEQEYRARRGASAG